MPLRPDQTLEVINARSLGRLPGLVGVRFTAVEEGMLAAELDIRPELIAPNGYLHAATVIALADTACGYGCLAHLPEGATLFTTIELKANFLGTAKEGALGVVARPAHLGRTTQVWDAVVTRKADAGTIALFRCTQMILWPAPDR
jgi:1,4-dihydroxy-2-naphthoyl-CoA hydrolase